MNTALQLQPNELLGCMKLTYSRRQQPDDPLRYDDRCGEFVAAAAAGLDFKGPTPADFVAVICRCLDVDPDKLTSNTRSRKRELVWARQLHMLTLNKIFNYTSGAAGAVYGKDHATAMHAFKTQLGLYETDKFYREITKDFWEMYEKY